jgi:hypothetical protein
MSSTKSLSTAFLLRTQGCDADVINALRQAELKRVKERELQRKLALQLIEIGFEPNGISAFLLNRQTVYVFCSCNPVIRKATCYVWFQVS